MSKKKITVACYCRVSTAKKEQASSLANQQSFFRDYIKGSDIYKLYKIYPDKGLSGTLLKRDQFNKMLLDAGLDITEQKINFKNYINAADGKDAVPVEIQYIDYYVKPSDRIPQFEEILVRDTSRFARNVGLLEDVLKKLQMKGVYVNFIDIGKTTRNEADLSFIRFVQTMDEQYVRDLSRKVRQGNERSIANKTVRSTSKLYGYTYKQQKNLSENNQLRTRDEEAFVIQLIFRLYAGCLTPETPVGNVIDCDFKCSTCSLLTTKGIGSRQIANYLSANNKKTRANKDFGKRTVNNILENEKYTGSINTGKYDTGTVFAKNTYAKVKDDYMVEPTEYIDTIVSMELFEICAARREERTNNKNSRGKAPSSGKYSGGFLVCGKCGANYHRNTDRGRAFYQCGRKKSHGLKACTSANVGESTIDAYLNRLSKGEFSFIYHTYRQSLIIDGLNALHRRLSFIRRNRDDDRVQELQAEQISLNDLLKGLYKDRRLNKVDLEVLEELISETEDSLSTVKTELIRYTQKPQQYLAEAKKLQSELEPLLSEHKEHEENINLTYTEGEMLSNLYNITVYGETNPTGGGKPAKVELIPAIYFPTDIDDFLSVEPDLKTYKPLKLEADVGVRLFKNKEDELASIALIKYEANELKTIPEEIKLFSHDTLNSTFSVLLDELKALQTLYSC